jgi:phosphatidylinositol alpha-1,6-mannosyltransferase
MSDERQLRVWILTPELHRRGGTEWSVAEKLERWRERFDLRLYTMRVQGVDLHGIPVRRIPWLPGPHLLRYGWWFVANRAARWWDARRLGPPDAVHSPGVNALDASTMSVHAIFARHWASAGRRVLAEFRRPGQVLSAMHRMFLWAVLRRLERNVYSGPATVWALSSGQARELEARFRRPSGSVPVVPHGVDGAVFTPEIRAVLRSASRDRLGVSANRVLLLVANDVHGKGVDSALAALRLLPDDVVLAIAGLADPGMVKVWSRLHGVVDRVLLWGHRGDMMERYAAADVLVAPSREDAFHQPTMEALASGLPVVVSSGAGVAELLEDGRHALVLDDPEDPRELAGHVARLLEGPELAARLAHEGRRLAKKHTWDRSAALGASLVEREVRTPRALVLAPDPQGIGGIQRATRTLIRALAETVGAERVGVLAVRSGERSDALPCRMLRPGRPGHRSRIGIWERVAYALVATRTARRWRGRLAVVCAHPHLAPVGLLAHLLTGAPYAVWCHGEEVWGRIGPLVRWSLRRAEAVFAPSRFTGRQVEARAGLPPGSAEVVPHALSQEVRADSNGRGRRPQRVVTVARLDPAHAYKGVDTLLAAWAKVVAEFPAAELIVVGDGPDRDRLETLAADLGLNGSVVFAGGVSDRALTDLYRSAAVFALPSRVSVGPRAEGEGFGLVFVEAAAAGLPVVAGRGGAVDEVVEDGETGLLVHPRDADEVAAAVGRLLADPRMAARLGEAGSRRVATEFTFERFRDRVARLVGDLAETPLPTPNLAAPRKEGSCASC